MFFLNRNIKNIISGPNFAEKKIRIWIKKIKENFLPTNNQTNWLLIIRYIKIIIKKHYIYRYIHIYW